VNRCLETEPVADLAVVAGVMKNVVTVVWDVEMVRVSKDLEHSEIAAESVALVKHAAFDRLEGTYSEQH